MVWLERTARHFYDPRDRRPSHPASVAAAVVVVVAASVPECAAALLLAQRNDSWRVHVRSAESCKFALHVLQELLVPLPQVAAGHSHSLLVAQGGNLLAFGLDDDRQLGLGRTDEPRDDTLPRHEEQQPAPQQVRWMEDKGAVVSVAAGSSHSCCLTSGGSLWSWGLAEEGTLGIGPLPSLAGDQPLVNTKITVAAPRPVLIAGGGVAVAVVAAGDAHTAAVLATGELFTWGEGSAGQLGLGRRDGSTAQYTPHLVDMGENPRVVGVSCGGWSTLIVAASGTLSMCGDIVTGQSEGEDPWRRRWVPEVIDCIDDSGKPARIRRASCGRNHFAAVDSTGQMFTFGVNTHGQLGHGPPPKQQPVRGSKCAGSVSNEAATLVVISEPRRVLGLPAVRSCSCGSNHSAAVSVDGQLWCWGKRSCIGLPPQGPPVLKPRAMRLPSPGRPAQVMVVEAGQGGHTLLVLEAGAVWAFGEYECGQLGSACAELMEIEDLTGNFYGPRQVPGVCAATAPQP